MSHLEMRKALAHGKSHFLSMESLPQHLGKMTSFSFVKKLPEEFKPILLTKKSPMLSHATVK